MGRNCLHCGYCQELKRKDGEEYYYCNDLDSTIDPYDPICSDEYYES